MSELVLDPCRLEQQRLHRQVLIRFGWDGEGGKPEGPLRGRRVEDLEKSFGADEVTALYAADHLVPRMNRAEAGAFLVVDLEHSGDTRIDDRLQYCRQIEVLQLAAKIAAGMGAEIGNGSLEATREALQVPPSGKWAIELRAVPVRTLASERVDPAPRYATGWSPISSLSTRQISTTPSSTR